VLLDEVRLKRRCNFVCRLQRMVDGPVPCGVVNHAASIPRSLLKTVLDGIDLDVPAGTVFPCSARMGRVRRRR
jgi:hypothetical protein